MKHSDPTQFMNDWEYQKAKRQEKREQKQKRDTRRNKKNNWQIKGADE